MKIKDKKCRNCGEKFTPHNSLQIACSYPCAAIIAKKKKDQEWQKEKKERKEALLTHSEWLNLLQKVFNAYIRKRDETEPCISCKNPTPKKINAGHFLSVGSRPNLRFNEDNVHLQCEYCNTYKHGNISNYRINLIEKIGVERVEILEQDQESAKLSIPEIKENIKHYKELTQSLI